MNIPIDVLFSTYRKLPFQAIKIAEAGSYRFTVRQQLWFNNAAMMTANKSFTFTFQLRVNDTIVDAYTRFVYLATGTGGYGNEITFDAYGDNLPVGANVELWVNSQFNLSAAELQNLKAADWLLNYGATKSRIIFQKLN